MRFFATASAGTEDLLAEELRELGLGSVRSSRGGVWFAGDLPDGMRACLWSRIAMRVLLPVAEFPAVDADTLYARAREVRWEVHLDPSRTFAIEAVGRTEALGHTHFTALKVKDAVVDVLRERCGARPNVNVEDPDVRIVAHLARGRASLSLDLAGEPLFKRGWRLAQTGATLKETLAAAILRACGYTGDQPLVDPMCGSGTLAIEAALIAQHHAPGVHRQFGVERWASFDASLRSALHRMRDEARRGVRRGAPPVFAFDRDTDAVRAAQVNVKRSGLPVQVRQADARQLAPLDPPGFVVVNPPWGMRMGAGGRRQLKTFFWQLGQAWRGLHGHRIGVLAGGPEFESAFGLRPKARRPLWNGPVRCMLLQYVLD
ncbi:MAG TPA: THUMP domain-containing protein [Candidatus Baltobacteraceae bacterium]|nr:THUMP domain-containing protein [Candidatus Baltobacteraceae bacterium]